MIEEDRSNELAQFWDENIANRVILQSLIEGDVKEPSDKSDNKDEFIWEAKDIALSLIDIKTAEDAAKTKGRFLHLERS